MFRLQSTSELEVPIVQMERLRLARAWEVPGRMEELLALPSENLTFSKTGRSRKRERREDWGGEAPTERGTSKGEKSPGSPPPPSGAPAVRSHPRPGLTHGGCADSLPPPFSKGIPLFLPFTCAHPGPCLPPPSHQNPPGPFQGHLLTTPRCCPRGALILPTLQMRKLRSVLRWSHAPVPPPCRVTSQLHPEPLESSLHVWAGAAVWGQQVAQRSQVFASRTVALEECPGPGPVPGTKRTWPLPAGLQPAGPGYEVCSTSARPRTPARKEEGTGQCHTPQAGSTIDRALPPPSGCGRR